MISLKRRRTQKRREFTIATDKFQNSTADTIDSTFAVLANIAEDLQHIEVELCNLWCDSEDFDEVAFQDDQDAAMEYRNRWITIKDTYNNTKVNTSSARPDDSCYNKKKLNVPKLELIKFDGNIKNWLLFWGQFRKIHEDEALEDSDKFQYLLQSMVSGSTARQLIESYPPCGENYNKALNALKARFARDDLLIETYVRGLLNVVISQQKGQLLELTTLYDSLQAHLQALETLGVTKDKYSHILAPMIESALPEEVLRAWNRARIINEGYNLNKLIDFLRDEVESEERIQLAHCSFDSSNCSDHSTRSSKPPTACFITNNKSKNGEKPESKACLWCNKDNHPSSECHKAMKMTPKERIDYITNKKACHICLRPNHTQKKCRSFPKCLFCKKRHFTIMCRDVNEQGPSNVTNTDNNMFNNLLCQQKTTTLLQTLVAKIIHNKKELQVRILIDTGAQKSYIKTDTVKQMNLKPVRREAFSQSLFGGHETEPKEHSIYNICLQSLYSNFMFQFEVVESVNICGFLPKVMSQQVIEQLSRKGVFLTENVNSPDDVSILIGADFSGQLLTGDILQLDSKLTAINTKMGWTIQGPITGIYSSITNMTTTLYCFNKIDITDLWTLETLGITDPCEKISKENREKDILNTFNSAITKINWTFLPPGAPWWGGFYERLIGVLKQMLRRVLGKASLTFSELQTVICDCEATINSRPLSYVGNNFENLKILTPAMFIQPLTDNNVQDLDQIDRKSLNLRAKYCQKLRDDFRQRFRNEYMSNLIQGGKRPKVIPLAIGDDGHSRVAKIKTARGFLVRPLQRLFPLEIPGKPNSCVVDKTQ